MNFTDIKTFTYIGGTVIVDGVQKEIETSLSEDITAVQFHKGDNYCLEEPLMNKVPLSKYQYALEEFTAASEVIEIVPTLDELKEAKLLEINRQCENQIISGFISNALGIEHTYQSERDDQINLMGLAIANTDDLLKCKESDTWDWKMHTSSQIKKVFDDGAAYKKELLLEATRLKAQVAAAQSIEELESIEV